MLDGEVVGVSFAVQGTGLSSQLNDLQDGGQGIRDAGNFNVFPLSVHTLLHECSKGVDNNVAFDGTFFGDRGRGRSE